MSYRDVILVIGIYAFFFFIVRVLVLVYRDLKYGHGHVRCLSATECEYTIRYKSGLTHFKLAFTSGVNSPVRSCDFVAPAHFIDLPPNYQLNLLKHAGYDNGVFIHSIVKVTALPKPTETQ